jgi:hypothetical protein
VPSSLPDFSHNTLTGSTYLVKLTSVYYTTNLSGFILFRIHADEKFIMMTDFCGCKVLLQDNEVVFSGSECYRRYRV